MWQAERCWVACARSQWVVGIEEASLGRISVMSVAEHGQLVSGMSGKDLGDVGCCLDVWNDTPLVWCHGVACSGSLKLETKGWTLDGTSRM